MTAEQFAIAFTNAKNQLENQFSERIKAGIPITDTEINSFMLMKSLSKISDDLAELKQFNENYKLKQL